MCAVFNLNIRSSVRFPLVACLTSLIGVLIGVSSTHAQPIVINPAALPGPDAVRDVQAGAALRAAMEELVNVPRALNEIVLLPGPGGPAFAYVLDRQVVDSGTPAAGLTGTKTVRSNASGLPIVITVRGQGATQIRIRRDPESNTDVGADTNARFRIFNVETGGSLILENLQLENGSAGEGGAARSASGNLLRLTNCTVLNNFARSQGGGLYARLTPPRPEERSDFGIGLNDFGLVINDCTIQGNRVTNAGSPGEGGGGIYSTESQFLLLGSSITCNSIVSTPTSGSTSGNGGGLFYNRGAAAPFKFQLRPNNANRPLIFSCNSVNSISGSGGGAFINGATRDVPGFGVDPQEDVVAQFYSNSAAEAGGGLYLVSVELIISRSQFGQQGSQVCDGGACTAPAGPSDFPNSNQFRWNVAPQGGGVFVTASTARFVRCNFDHNWARTQGGFIGKGGGAFGLGGTTVFEECCFTGNSADNTGGGAYMQNKSNPLFDDCVFKQNRAVRGGGIGMAAEAEALIYNCVVTHNVGRNEGGGVWIQDATPSMLHTTIARNLSSGLGLAPPAAGNITGGTGVHRSVVDDTGQPVTTGADILNCIIWGNARGLSGNNGGSLSSAGAGPPFAGSAATVFVRFSLIDTLDGSSFPATRAPSDPPLPAVAGSNFDSDPRFVNLDGTDAALPPDGNVHLTCPSPAIDRASLAHALAKIAEFVNLNDSPVFLTYSPTSPSTNLDPAIGLTGNDLSLFVKLFGHDYDDKAFAAGDPLETQDYSPLGDEPCPAANCRLTPYIGGEAVQTRTCRATQCQSDMGADESRNLFVVPPIADKVVCLGGSQSFTATANCPDRSACDPNTAGPTFLFQWCRLDVGVGGVCIEVPINNPFIPGQAVAPGYSVSPGNGTPGTSSTLTINPAIARDNTVFKVKVFRGGLGVFAPLGGFVTVNGVNYNVEGCDPLFGCPPAFQLARLFVIDPPTVVVVPPNPDIVCRTSNQCLEWDVTWAVLPTTPITQCGYTSVGPIACIPTFAFTKTTSIPGTAVPIASNDPRIQSDAPVIANGRATQRWRLCFTNAQDSDCARYNLTVNCGNLAAGKCTPASAAADLCVTPPPTASSGGDKTVCEGGAQTLTFTATFPDSLCVFCPGAPCIGSAIVTKNGVALPPAAYVCDPINASRQINCRVVFASALAADCGTYCIEARCSNLADGKCGLARACANLCVLPLPIVTADPPQSVCTGGAQTLNFSATFPVGACAFCTASSCTPSVVIRRAGVVLPAASFTCDPITAARVINCSVRVASATNADCAEYCIEATCSNLSTQGKCGIARACTTLCVLPPITASADPDKSVCEGGRQTLNFSATFPVGSCQFCTGASCTPSIVLKKGAAIIPAASYTCEPITVGRTINCRLVINTATLADCAEYCIEATCSNLATGKCGLTRACTRLCVLAPPTAGGDPDATVCLNGDQTINFFANFPVGTCQFCTNASCTPTVVLKKDGVALPSSRYTCDLITAARRINCRIRFNPAALADQAEYCIEASCSNLADGKCITARYCAKLCVVQPSISTSDQKVCVGGQQTLEFTANYPPGNPAFCPTGACTPIVTITKNGVNLPASQVACTPLNANAQICRVVIPSATLADAGEYCASLSCSNLTAAKCPPVRACARLCVVPAPTCGADSPACVCRGGDQTINLFATFPLPTGPAASFCPVGLADCIPAVTIKKGGVVLAAGRFTCDPITAQRRINCSVSIIDALDSDAGEYCIEASYSNINPTKCPPTRCCTTLTVENPPSITSTTPTKICIGQDSMSDITFTAPPCCTPAFSFRKDGVAISLGSHFQFTGTGGTRQFKIRNATIDDRGLYEICLSCSNLNSNKCDQVCTTFRVDILEPPTISPPPPVSTCRGDSEECFTFSYTHNPLCPALFTLRKGAVVLCANVPEFDNPATPGVQENRCVNGRFTFRPGAAANTREVCITNVQDGDAGDYQLCITYANLNPIGVCEACATVRVNVDTIIVMLPPLCVCPDQRTELCATVDGCDGVPEVIYCFTWFKNGVIYQFNGQTFDGCSPTGTNSSCITVVAPPSMDTPDLYRVRVTPNNPATCPCPPAETTTQVRLCPPEQCCWCVPCEDPHLAWDNGRYDRIDGAFSAIPALYEFPEIKVADDFSLCEGNLHKLKKFAGTMRIRQNPALPYKATLTLYEDCDGCPGRVIKVFDDTYIDNVCRFGDPDADGFQEIVFEFNLMDQDEKFWLEGGATYWFSLQGRGELTEGYEAYWVTANNRVIRGSVPKKMEIGVDQTWRPLDECCIECTDLSFCVEAEMCKILIDNGKPGPARTAGGSRSEKSTSPSRNSRAADQLVINTCNDYKVCVIEGYIYTNCIGFNSWLEIYENDCNMPAYLLTGTPYFRWLAESVVDLEYTVTIDGVELRVYKVSFCPVPNQQYPMGLIFQRNRNYWVSISVEDTFSQIQRAYFAWNRDPCDTCLINFMPGKEIAPGRGVVRWTGVANDFAFRIAAKALQPGMTDPSPVPIIVPPTCPQDVNGDGNVTLQDLFDYLDIFFSGCP